MTRRRRRRSVAPPVTAIAVTAVAVAAATTVLHLIGWVAATAAVGAVCWYTGRRRALPATRARTTRARTTRPAARRAPAAPPDDGQVRQLRADLAQLRDALADAKASATAAWDAAAARPPARRVTSDTAPLDAEHLADTPMSGVRRTGQ